MVLDKSVLVFYTNQKSLGVPNQVKGTINKPKMMVYSQLERVSDRYTVKVPVRASNTVVAPVSVIRTLAMAIRL